MMYFYHFWCPKMKPWSALMAHLGLLLTFVTLGCSGVMCPDKCVCDDQSLKHDCSDGDLEGIPIFFNPETKVLKVRFYLTIMKSLGIKILMVFFGLKQSYDVF